MKRFGIPVLLSAVYVCLMVFVFSSDFGKNNSFFFSDKPAPEANTNITLPTHTPDNSLSNILSSEDQSEPVISQGEEAGAAHHSN